MWYKNILGSKESQKSKSSKKSRRGEPRKNLVSIKKLSKEKPQSPSQKDGDSVRTAGRNVSSLNLNSEFW